MFRPDIVRLNLAHLAEDATTVMPEIVFGVMVRLNLAHLAEDATCSILQGHNMSITASI